ncbi:AraC family transcriptional regulator [Paenibacillus sp. LHD-117]|uniref:AraC family transcriptional regulator n=1 Tax=Paenibacillus sp. LHD-117 TaxID=3071412 RepID=UPI0027DFA089|nr:AraC family transcriptional regulator [Paenibacillus sp. LHD-117]MDQ6421667.1 AraC family transcriptional regulator [Paenibacillus sp. LHD-117]
MSSIYGKIELPYLCKLLYENIQLPICYLTEDDSENIYFGDYQVNPLFTGWREFSASLVRETPDCEFPTIHSTNLLEQFIALPVKQTGERIGTVIIGPATIAKPSEEVIRNVLNDNQLPSHQMPLWSRYWSSLRITSKLQLFHIGVLAHLIINGEALEITDIIEYNFRLETPFNLKDNVDLVLSDIREFSALHSIQEVEKLLHMHIKSGNTAAIMNMIAEGSFEGGGTLAKKSHLRNRKNLAICIIAITTRTAMEGGLYAELAYTLSDLHIQHIEELQEERAVEVAMMQAILDFTDRVRLLRKSSNSKPIEVCREYIFNHLYEDISLGKLSEQTGLNSEYLSYLFKKETGITISHFIQKERVEEAKKLLDFTKDSISTIALRLNFCDQTYFIKVFKKHMGITPKQYRDKKNFTNRFHSFV